MADWTELPGFPKRYESNCAPWSSVTRLVNGVREMKNGKAVMLSGAKAFAQRLEADLIAAHRTTPDVPDLVNAVLDANAKHLDVVEWCRVRGDDLDLSLRVYASRGSTRLHLSLAGPVGRYADQPLPDRAAPPAPRSRAKKQVTEAPASAPPPDPVAPPAAPLLLQPIAGGARPNYGDVIAFDRDGRLHVTLRLPDAGDYHYAAIDPSGAVTLAQLPRRDALRADDAGAMTDGLMPELHATTAGLVRIEHYDHASGMKERVGFAGRWHASRRGLFDACWVLGIRSEWFLRCIVHGKKATLTGAHLTSGKRLRIALPEGIVVRSAALDGDVLRVVDAESEHRFPLRVARTLDLDTGAATVIPHGQAGFVHPVPGTGGWAVAEGRVLRFVGQGGAGRDLFTLPDAFTSPSFAPWGAPRVTEIDGASWLVTFDFGADDGPRCTGALIFTESGAVLNRAHIDVSGTLHLGTTTLPLAPGEHVLGYAGGPAGALAALVMTNAGLTVLWSPG